MLNKGLIGILAAVTIGSGCAYGKENEIDPLICEKPVNPVCRRRAVGLWVKENDLSTLEAYINGNQPQLGAFNFNEKDNTVDITYVNKNEVYHFVPSRPGSDSYQDDGSHMYVGRIKFKKYPKEVFVYVVDEEVNDYEINM